MKKIRPLVIILAFNLIFYLPVFSNKTPLPADNLLAYSPWKFYAPGYQAKGPAYFDVMNIMYPWKKLAVSEIKQGKFPLWNKFFGLGYPYFAAMQGGILYPTTLLFLIFPFDLAWSLHIFLQTFLAGVFMYWLLRHYKLSQWSSLFGALSFSFSGHFLVWLEYGTLVNAACWLPLIILLIEYLFEKRKLWISLLIGLILAVSFMAGFPQTSFYVAGFSLIYYVFRFSQIRRVRLVIYGLISLLTFFGLSAIQLFPFLEYLSLSTRNFADPRKYFSWAILPTNLIGYIFPNFFGHPSHNLFWGRGNYQEFTVYLGAIPFVLAVWAILRKKAPKFWLWSLVVIAFFLVYNPLLLLFYKLNLPIISKMAPSRLIILLTFVMSIISAYGFDHFIKGKRLPIVDFLIIYLGMLIFLVLDILFFKLNFIQLRFGYQFEKIFREITSSLFFPLLIIWLFTLAVILVDLGKIGRKGLLRILILITAFDLFVFGREYNPFINAGKVIPKTKTVNFLQKDKTDFRFFSEAGIFPTNYSSLFALSGVDATDTLVPVNYSDFINRLGKKELISRKEDLFNLVNVKYYLTKNIINDKNYRLVFTGEEIKIYLRNSFLPRYYFIPDGDNRALPVKKVQEGASKLTLEVDAPQKGKLIVGNLYFPGWEAKVNNVRAKILPYKEVFSSVEINKGENMVELRYNPMSFRIGSLKTLTTLILITSFFGLQAVRYVRNNYY